VASSYFQIEVDPFFRQTRLMICVAKQCRFNSRHESQCFCSLKHIAIGEDGGCKQFEPREA